MTKNNILKFMKVLEGIRLKINELHHLSGEVIMPVDDTSLRESADFKKYLNKIGESCNEFKDYLQKMEQNDSK